MTQKFLRARAVTGHRLPSALPAADRGRVELAIGHACAALGYRDGPLNFDAMVGERDVVLLEISPRNGGNGLTDLVRHAFGVDLELALVRQALGRAPGLDPWPVRGTAVCVLGSPEPARLARLPDAEAWRAVCPAVIDVAYTRRVGDRIGPFADNGQAFGHVVFGCDGPVEHADRLSVLEAFSRTMTAPA